MEKNSELPTRLLFQVDGEGEELPPKSPSKNPRCGTKCVRSGSTVLLDLFLLVSILSLIDRLRWPFLVQRIPESDLDGCEKCFWYGM